MVSTTLAHRMKKITTVLVVLAFLAICAVLLCRGGGDLCPKVNISSIRKVQLDMTRSDVIEILGEPYATDPGHHGTNTFIMIYSRPVRWVRWYPMLWVHLTSGVVRSVYAKRYVCWGIDDEGVYGLSHKQKPWETKYFESTFQNN
jgi:outer membrane protein assembly factor BamE (lipoprotein component of BamABCDE complex)